MVWDQSYASSNIVMAIILPLKQIFVGRNTEVCYCIANNILFSYNTRQTQRKCRHCGTYVFEEKNSNLKCVFIVPRFTMNIGK